MIRIKRTMIYLIITLIVCGLNFDKAYAKSSLDLVFIIDSSASMDDDIENVRANINSFVDKLVEAEIDYRLGLVSYEKTPSRYSITNNVEQFKANLGLIKVAGGTENGLDAIMEASNYTFRESALKYFVLVGDEPIFSDRNYDDASVIKYAIDNGIVVTTIGLLTDERVKNQFEQFEDTGGLLIDLLQSDFGEKLTNIYSNINNLPKTTVITPKSNAWISESFIPTISIDDANNSNWFVSCKIDDVIILSDLEITKTDGVVNRNLDNIDVSGFEDGDHKLIIEVNDTEDIVKSSVDIRVDNTAPTINDLVGNINITTNSIDINIIADDNIFGIDKSSGISKYRITIDGKQREWSTDSAVHISDLLPSSPHVIKVEVSDNAGNIGVMEQTIYTKAEIPKLEDEGITTNSIDLLINDDNSGDTSYMIKVGNQYITNGGSLSSQEQWIQPINNRIRLTNLEANTSYNIAIKAKNAANIETGWNSITKITLPTKPIFTSSESTNEAINLKWDSISGVNNYELRMGNEIISIGNKSSYTYNNLEPDQEYSFSIRSLNDSGFSAWSDILKIRTLPLPPVKVTNINILNTEQTSIDIEWNTADRATSYEILVDGSKMIEVNQNDPRFTIDNLLPEQEYVVKIRGKNIGGVGVWSDSIALETLPNTPSSPEMISAETAIDYVTVHWSPVENAEGYHLMIDGTIHSEILEETTFVHEDLAPASGHSYKVRAVRAILPESSVARVIGDWTKQIDVTTNPLEPIAPNNIISTATKESITLTWYEVPYAQEYYVYIDGSANAEIIKTTSYIHTGLNPDEKHTYKIKAKNITGYSPMSKTVSAYTLPDDKDEDGEPVSLTNMVAVVTNNMITLSWETAVYKAEYEIEVDGDLIDIGEDTVYVHEGLGPEEYHNYKIRVKNPDGINAWSGILSLSTLPDPPTTPVTLEAVPFDRKIELRWEHAEGAIGYDIEADGKLLGTTEDTKYIHEPLQSGTTHIYRIRAKAASGVTDWSSAVTESTTNPNYIVNCTAGDIFELSVIADNIQDFSEILFDLGYNPEEIEIVDLNSFTPKEDKIGGKIPNTDLIVDLNNGQAIITKDKNIPPGKSWSGEVTSIRFRAKITGQSTITLTVKSGEETSEGES